MAIFRVRFNYSPGVRALKEDGSVAEGGLVLEQPAQDRGRGRWLHRLSREVRRVLGWR